MHCATPSGVIAEGRLLTRRCRLLTGVLILVLGLSWVAAQRATADPLGPVPPASSLPESRCAYLTLAPHVVDVSQKGARIIGSVKPGCGFPKDNSFDWSAYPGLEPVRGCRHDETSCVLKPVAGTGKYQVGCINGANTQGSWISCDYYGVLGPKCAVLSGRVTERGRPVAGVSIEAINEKRSYTAVTDPSGSYSIPLCDKGEYSVSAADAVVFHHVGGPNSPEAYVFAKFSPLGGSGCRDVTAVGFDSNPCLVDLDHDRTVNFYASSTTTYISIPPGEGAGSHLFNPNTKYVLRQTAGRLAAASWTAGSYSAYIGTLSLVSLAGGPAGAPSFVLGEGTAGTLAGISAVTGGSAVVVGLLADYVDPFDPDYKVVAKPVVARLPRMRLPRGRMARELKKLVRDVETELGITQALDTTLNRYASAAESGDSGSAGIQRNAAVEYLRRLASLMNAQIKGQRSLALAMRAAHIRKVRAHHGLSGERAAVALAQEWSALGVNPASALAIAAALNKSRLPRAVDPAKLVAAPSLLRAEHSAVAAFQAAARQL